MAKEKISITINSELIAKIRTEAEKDSRSLSSYIETIIKKVV